MEHVIERIEGGVRRHGLLADGSPFEIRVPERWNGYLVTQPDLWSNESELVGERWLTTEGFASARHSRDVRGWHLGRALENQAELVRLVETHHGRPRRGKIVWGGSMGGLLARLIPERFPGEYLGSIPQDGGGEGVLGPFERGLDMAFVLSTLLTPAGGRIRLSLTEDHAVESERLAALLVSAGRVPSGRARIALAAAVGMMVDWSDPALDRPDANDPEQVVDHWIHGLQETLPQAYRYRVQLETVAGGAFCGNADVDYARLLERSGQSDRVAEMYDRAGLVLDDDLDALAAEPRLIPSPAAHRVVLGDYQLTGAVDCPVLVLKVVGDPDAVPHGEAEYRRFLRAAGRSHLLRVAWVDAAGHLNTTVAERAAALTALVERIETGAWGGSTSPVALNDRAHRIAAASSLDLAAYGMQERAPGRGGALARFVAHAARPFVRSDG